MPNQEVVLLAPSAVFAFTSGWAGWVFLLNPHRLAWRIASGLVALFTALITVLCVVTAPTNWLQP